jgi:hypothetical protein
MILTPLRIKDDDDNDYDDDDGDQHYNYLPLLLLSPPICPPPVETGYLLVAFKGDACNLSLIPCLHKHGDVSSQHIDYTKLVGIDYTDAPHDTFENTQ